MKRITIIAAAGAVLLAGCSGGNADADGNGDAQDALALTELGNHARAYGRMRPGTGRASSALY